MIARWLTFVAGLWIFFSAFWLLYVDTAFYVNNIVCGLAIAALALVAMSPEGEPLRWASAALGVWLIASAWIFRGGPAAIANDVILGLMVVVAAAIESVPGASRPTLGPGSAHPSQA